MRLLLCVLTLAAFALFTPDSDAGLLRRRCGQSTGILVRTRTVERTRVLHLQRGLFRGGCRSCNSAPASATPAEPVKPPTKKIKITIEGAVDALEEVNAARQARGLRPFIRDDGLIHAALSAARARAQMRRAGHIDDFAHLPEGTYASAAGCAAWPAELGWGACCTYESFTYAGAAYAIGEDGQRYMHLFVR